MPELVDGALNAILIGLFIGGVIAFLLVAFVRIFLPENSPAAQRLDGLTWEAGVSAPFRGFRPGGEGESSACSGDGGSGD